MKFEVPLHGGDIFAAARDLGRSPGEILDFSANVNPLGPPPGLKKHLLTIWPLLQHYPDPYALGWREELADRHHLSPKEILAGNGTTALMHLIPRALNPQRPVIISPAFVEYQQALGRCGRSGAHIHCRLEDNYNITSATIDAVMALSPDLIFLANPTSPAGRLVAPEMVDRLIHLAAQTSAVIVLDEAFLDFTGEASWARAVRQHKNLIVLRSLTKFYALPGLRLGYLTAAEPLVAKLMAQLEPWSVNTLALAAGSYCLNQAEYARATREVVTRERTWLRQHLTQLDLGQVIPGTANYLLMRVSEACQPVEALVSEVRTRSILVRDCASFPGLAGYIRVAVKTRGANQRLTRVFTEILIRRRLHGQRKSPREN